MQHVVHGHGDIDGASKRVIRRLTCLRDSVDDRVLVARPGGPIIHTRLQLIFNFKFDDPLERAIHEIIVTHAYAAERLGPGAFDACIERLLKKFDGGTGGNNGGMIHENSGVIDDIRPQPATSSDIVWVLEQYMANVNVRTRTMLTLALDLAGFAGRIIVEKARSRPSVELIRGYTFEHAPAWPISVRLERPRVVVIDGFIESVAELNRLLQDAAETRESVLLFVRGLADDVINTLRVNYDRGSLRVIPIIARFDIDGINSLNDVSVASGADMISSHKGDLISNVMLGTSPRIDEAIIYPTKVVVTNTTSRRAVEAHVAFLRRKRQDEKIDDVARLFDARIRSLSPNHVVIRLPDDKDYVTSAQAIDYALRAVRVLVDYGTVDDQRALTATSIASRLHAERCYDTLVSLGTLITSAVRPT
jgi:hypothetical protein